MSETPVVQRKSKAAQAAERIQELEAQCALLQSQLPKAPSGRPKICLDETKRADILTRCGLGAPKQRVAKDLGVSLYTVQSVLRQKKAAE